MTEQDDPIEGQEPQFSPEEAAIELARKEAAGRLDEEIEGSLETILEQARRRWTAEEENSKRLAVRSRLLVTIQTTLFGVGAAALIGTVSKVSGESGQSPSLWWVLPLLLVASGTGFVIVSLLGVLRARKPKLKRAGKPRRSMASYALEWPASEIDPWEVLQGGYSKEQISYASWTQFEMASTHLHRLNLRKQDDIARSQLILGAGILLLTLASMSYALVGWFQLPSAALAQGGAVEQPK